MTAQDQVRIILRNIEAMGKPYPDFVMQEPRKFYEAPQTPLRTLYCAGIGCGVSITFMSAAVALFPFLVSQQ